MFSIIKKSLENVTIKTIARTLLVTVVVLILSFLFINIANNVADNINNEYERLNNMIKVTNQDVLDYCINSKQNEFLIRNKAISINPVSLPELKGNFSAIIKTKYKYESHIETYTTTYTDSNGHTHTQTHTKTVWDWERKGSEKFKASTVSLLNKTFDFDNTSYYYKEINFEDYSNKNDKHYKDGHYNYENNNTRYKYEIVPNEYETAFVSDYNMRMLDGFYDKSIEEITARKSTTWVYVLFYTLLFIILISAIVLLIFWEEIFKTFLCD